MRGRRAIRAVGAGLVTGLGTGLTGRLPPSQAALVSGGVLGGLVAVGGVVSAVRGQGATALGAGTDANVSSAARLGRGTLLAVAAGTAVGATAATSLWVSLLIDRTVVERLRRRGVTRPRLALSLVLGVAAGILECLDTHDQAGAAAGRRPSSDSAATASPSSRPRADSRAVPTVRP